ncbi:hypothetical protein Q1695_000337 [Nippostrongylus brasiliensis]|nr:hypothetical protein Q1695_000337 [Nippostrongylus brasiliensis]
MLAQSGEGTSDGGVVPMRKSSSDMNIRKGSLASNPSGSNDAIYSWKRRAQLNSAVDRLCAELQKYRQSVVWTTVFPNSSEHVVKRRNGLWRTAIGGSGKFLKNVTRGVHLASFICHDDRILCTNDDCFPIISVDESTTAVSKENHQWLLKMSHAWETIDDLMLSNTGQYTDNICLSFRSKLINAVISMRSALGIDIGYLYQVPIIEGNCVFLATIRTSVNNDELHETSLRWLPISKVFRRKASFPILYSLMSKIMDEVDFMRSSARPLGRGLYLGYVRLYSSLNSVNIAVSKKVASFIPHMWVRDNPRITQEEWQSITVTDMSKVLPLSNSQLQFRAAISTAVNKLFDGLNIDADIVPGHRMYKAEIIAPNDEVSVILIVPRPDDVCSAPSALLSVDESHDHRKTIPIAVFEQIYHFTYQTAFFTKFCRLSVILDHFMMVAQYEQRRCLLQNDVTVYKSIYERLEQFQKTLDEVWNSARWVSRVASEAREKCAGLEGNTVPLTGLLTSGDEHKCSQYKSFDTLCGSLPWKQRMPSKPAPQNTNSFSFRRHSATQLQMDRKASKNEPNSKDKEAAAETVAVFPVYECGLDDGFSARISIGENSTSAEVVRLVLEKVAETSPQLLKNCQEIGNFCLVAVMGTRERRLKDDFILSRLQKPWTKGRLCVRRRSALLGAVHHGNEANV